MEERAAAEEALDNLRETMTAGDEKEKGASLGKVMFLLLFLVLLLAVAGGAWYSQKTPLGEAIPVPHAEKRPITFPVPPAPPAVKKDQAQGNGIETEQSEVTVRTGPDTSAVRQEDSGAHSQVPAEASLPAPDSGTVAAAAAPEPAFVLQTDGFLVPERLLHAKKVVRGLGFDASEQSVPKQVAMTRLRVGMFSPAQARQKMKELEKEVPQVFSLARGNQVAVYAGSFSDLDQARRFADRLFQKGILVEEEAATVELQLKGLRFGEFTDRPSAEVAAKEARALGLLAEVVSLQ